MLSVNKVFKLIIILLLIIVVSSCEQQGSLVQIKHINPVFKIEQSLKGRAKMSTVDLFAPTSMIIADNKLIIADASTDFVFKVYDLHTLEFQYQAGRKGNGPEELTSPFAESVFISDNVIEIQDNNKIKKYRINDRGFEFLGYELLPIIGNPINRLTKLNDTLYVADNSMNDKSAELIMISVKNSEVINKFGQYYDDGIDFEDNFDLYSTYIKSLTSSEKAKKIAAFYTYFNRFKIFDHNGRLIKDVEIINDEYLNQNFESKLILKNIMYQVIPFSTPDNIFSMEIGKTKEAMFDEADTFEPILNVWDWEGNPVARFTLDRFVTSYVIHGNRIYATSITDTNKIYIYQLPNLSTKNKNEINSFLPVKTTQFETIIPEGYEPLDDVETYEVAGYDYTRQYYGNTAVGGICPGSIRFALYSSPGKAISFEQYESTIGNDIFGEFEIFAYQQENEKLPDIFTFERTIDQTDQNGKVYQLNTMAWIWTYDDNIVELTFVTCSDPNELSPFISEIVKKTDIM